MMTEKSPSEPSMDEILASIRKIISADTKEEVPSFFSHNAAEDVLDLTDALPDDRESSQMPPRSSEFPFHNGNEWSPPTEKADVGEETKSEVEGQNAPSYESLANSSFEDVLLSQITLSETTQAFGVLNKAMQKKTSSSNVPSSEGIGGQTLENLIREMLKPLLKEWLDVHLPALVLHVVTQQVEKIVQQTNRPSPEPSKESLKDSFDAKSNYFSS